MKKNFGSLKKRCIFACVIKRLNDYYQVVADN